jgi:ethanolaminephosphotransferase
MVVDALRASYAFGNTTQMHYLRHLIDSGQAVAYVAHAHAPTVTLPRIKALTAGTVPNFLDLLRNFDSAQVADDNLIDRLVAAQRRLVFYGDDTWQKLFPGRFRREEGTTSFFVQDTVEVDVNVTRNVLVELQRDDWDVMILHYLGLDHIGHWQGPASPLMAPKQREMDTVIRSILRSLAALDRLEAQRNARLRLAPPKPSLLLVCSDHGMTDQGGHGGTTLPESSTVAVFAAASAAALVDEGDVPSHWPRHHDNIAPPRVQQVDVAPTLALLLGVPIPTSSIGVVLPDVLLGAPVPGQRTHSPTSGGAAPFLIESTPLRMQHLLRAYQINAAQYENALRHERTLWSVADDAPATDAMRRLWHKLDAAKSNHRRWLLTDANAERARSAQLGNQTRELYEEFLQGVQHEFIQLLTNSDLSLLLAGTVTLLAIGLALLSQTAALASGGDPLRDTRLLVFSSLVATVAVGAALLTYCGDGSASVSGGVCQWREFGLPLGTALFAFAIAVGCALTAVGVSHERRSLSSAGVFAIVGTVLHWLSLSGTSLVEEEHLCWYYLTATIVAVRVFELVLQRDSAWRDALVLLACMRLSRVWNQTGTAWNSKTAGGSSIVPRNDIGEWLSTHTTPQYVLYAVHCAGLFYALHLWRRRYAQHWLASLAAIQTSLAIVCVFVFKWHSDALASLCRDKTVAQAAYALLVASFCATVLQLATGHDSLQHRLREFFLHTTLAVVALATLVQRGHNAALLGLFVLQGWLLHRTLRSCGSAWLRALVFEWFGIAALFAMGNSNSTATIEISGAYTGFDEFYQVVIGGLVWLIVYTGPFLFFLMLCASALDQTAPSGVTAQAFAIASTLTSGRAAMTAGLFSIYCIALRHHLFVWSVMSPKYLYVVGGTAMVALQVLVSGLLAVVLSPTSQSSALKER